VQGKINRGRHTDHPVGRHSVRTNQCPPPPSSRFLQAGCPSCRPTNSVKALKATSAFRLGRRRCGVLLNGVTCAISILYSSLAQFKIINATRKMAADHYCRLTLTAQQNMTTIICISYNIWQNNQLLMVLGLLLSKISKLFQDPNYFSSAFP